MGTLELLSEMMGVRDRELRESASATASLFTAKQGMCNLINLPLAFGP